MSSTLRIVIAVSGNPQRAEFLDALLPDTGECDVIVVESLAGAYSRVKREMPNLVIVLCEVDDLPACQLLSMLKMDPATSWIPVETWATKPETSEFNDIVADVNFHSSSRGVAIQMN
jgi:hypothetical protein